MAVAPAAAATCAATPGDHVAVVIDYGAFPGGDGLWSRCVRWSPGMTGMQVLRAATGGQVGTDRSGKVCQIRGLPGDFDVGNCSAPRDGKLSYWAYFRGDGSSWTYSGVGSAGVRADPQVVEGWRYVTVPVSQHTSTAEPPRNFTDGRSYRWQSVCQAEPTPPPTTRRSSPRRPRPGGDGSTATPAPPPDSGGQPGAGSRGERDRSGNGTDRSSAAPSTAPRTTGSTRSDRTTTTTTEPDPTTTLRGTGGLRSSGTAPRLTDQDLAAVAEASGPTGRPVGAIVAGVGGTGAVVVGLAVVTGWSRRRRNRAHHPGTDPPD